MNGPRTNNIACNRIPFTRNIEGTEREKAGTRKGNGKEKEGTRTKQYGKVQRNRTGREIENIASSRHPL